MTDYDDWTITGYELLPDVFHNTLQHQSMRVEPLPEMPPQTPAEYLMSEYEFGRYCGRDNPCCNELIEWRYDYCDDCEAGERTRRMHWHADRWICSFDNMWNEEWDVPAIRPSDKFSTP